MNKEAMISAINSKFEDLKTQYDPKLREKKIEAYVDSVK